MTSTLNTYFKAAEVDAIRIGDDFRFPSAEGIIGQPGSDRDKAHRVRRYSSKNVGGDLRLDDDDLEMAS